jgi:serine/threonine-protein kinase
MGAVFLGRRDDGALVAIKQQHAHLVDDPDALASFVDEARLAARIQHPNVVSVIDFAMSGGNLVLVMEYVEGASLAALTRSVETRKQSPVHWTEAVRVMVDALRGLDAAHELRDHRGLLLGVVHRDVSPQNILVGIDGVARVTDFGVARAVGRLKATRTGEGVAGKLRYLAPEQIAREPVDRRVDVFAAGTVLWECLTGESLFGADTDAETVARLIRGKIDPPSVHRHEIPLELDEVCLRALERDPNRRFPTAAAFADALEAVGPAPRGQIIDVVTASTAAELAKLHELIAQPPRDDAEIVVTAVNQVGAAKGPVSRIRGALPVVIGALLVGLLAGGLSVGVLARRSQPEASIPTPEAPPPTATPAAVETTLEVYTEEAPVPPVVPAVSERSQPTRRSPTHKSKSARQDGGVQPFVPTEM